MSDTFITYDEDNPDHYSTDLGAWVEVNHDNDFVMIHPYGTSNANHSVPVYFENAELDRLITILQYILEKEGGVKDETA